MCTTRIDVKLEKEAEVVNTLTKYIKERKAKETVK